MNKNNIDDEFASLFLQELNNTNQLNGNNQTGKSIRPSNSEIDILNQYNFEEQSKSIIGAASYARYLPLETTFSSSNLLDFNYFEESGALFDANADNNDMITFRARSRTSLMEMATEKKKNGENEKIAEAVNDFAENDGVDNYEQDPEFISQVLDLLKLKSNQPHLGISATMSGRLYTNPECIKNDELLKLSCYRRNCISIHLDIDLTNLHLTPESTLKLKLYNSLRKHKSSEEGCTTLTAKEEFTFSETLPFNKRREVINQSESSFPYAKLEKIQKDNIVSFTWDQLKFKSATANNRYDAMSKYYTIIIEVEIAGETSVTLESQPIIVRGRNPSFYANKGDVLISKISMNEKKLNKRKKSKERDPTPTFEEIPDPPQESSEVLQPEQSSYQYFPVGDSYYQPPVEVGYFPHHVHHNKQVFEPIYNSKVLDSVQSNPQYKYYI